MTSLAAILLPLLELEDDELLAATLGDDLTRNLGALYEGIAKLRAIAAKEENFIESDRVASCALELFDSNEVALRDAILLAAGADNCVCHGKGRES